MSTLFIIGNGFDCHFQLHTTVCDFKSYLSDEYDYDGNNLLDVLEGYGVDWGEYEDSLSEIELREIEERIVYPNYLSDHESDRDGGIFEMECYTESLRGGVFSALNNMISDANEDLTKIKLQSPFYNEEDAILSFNYTSTIERLFFPLRHIPILHIHGFWENNDNLIFGYRNGNGEYESYLKHIPDENHDYYVDSQQEKILALYRSLKKELKLDVLQNYIQKFNFDKIAVLGHSMSPVDREYMEMIERTTHPKEWEVSAFKGNPSKKQLSTYSFSSKIKIIKVEDYLR